MIGMLHETARPAFFLPVAPGRFSLVTVHIVLDALGPEAHIFGP